jgi:hypothetical protein
MVCFGFVFRIYIYIYHSRHRSVSTLDFPQPHMVSMYECVHVVCGRFINSTKVKRTFRPIMHPDWISEDVQVSPSRSTSSGTSSPADSISSGDSALSAPLVRSSSASSTPRSLSVAIDDAILIDSKSLDVCITTPSKRAGRGTSSLVRSPSLSPVGASSKARSLFVGNDTGNVTDGKRVIGGIIPPLCTRRIDGRSVSPFQGRALNTGDGIGRFFTPPRSRPVSAIVGTSSVVSDELVCDLTLKCKACDNEVTGGHKCSVCKAPLHSLLLCSKKRRIVVDVEGVFWCEDCVVDDDTDVLADNADASQHSDDEAHDATFSVMHSLDADKPSPPAPLAVRIAARTRSRSTR